MNPPETALARRAAELGVETVHRDLDGHDRVADPDVLRAVVDVLEADLPSGPAPLVDHIQVTAPDHVGRRLSVPVRIDEIELMVDGSSLPARAVADGDGTTVLLPDDLPVGCHTLSIAAGSHTEESLIVVAPPTMPDLTDLTGRRHHSALFVPTYALWSDRDPLPSFRHLADAASTLGALGVDLLATLPIHAQFLDRPYDPSPYSPVSRLHWNEVYLDDTSLPAVPTPVIGDEVPWKELARRRRRQLETLAAGADDDLVARLDRHRAERPDVGSYARFRARHDADGDLVVERSHVLAQMWCDEQLARVRSAGSAQLALDLPIGSHPDGWETWAHPDLFASDVTVGAPPDAFFRGGQDWGFRPQLPGEMRRTGYQLWRRLVERAATQADLLRIDHVMAVHRLWWIPDGIDADRGVYVRYPRDELLAVVAATAAASGVAIVGENLGTVPPEIDDAMRDWRMLGMYEEQFETGRARLADIPVHAVVGIRTHDMDAFARHTATTDLRRYRHLLEVASGRPVTDLLDAVLARLARSDAQVVVADLDDLTGEERPHNVPGQVIDGLWRRRLDRPLDAVLDDPSVRRRLELLRRSRT